MVSREYGKKMPILGKALRLFLFLFLAASAVLNGILFAMYFTEKENKLKRLEEVERYSVSLQHQVIHDSLAVIFGDVLFLSQQNELTGYLQSRESNLLDQAGAEYLAFARNHTDYDQIRYLNAAGKELIRVNNTVDGPRIVAADKLQNKAKRNYILGCNQLKQGELFLSRFDLNIEHGEIEKPYKPTIRIGTPIFNAQGNRAGIVLVNYLGEKLLEQIRNSAFIARGKAMLLNSDGYWLLAPDAQKEWGFILNQPEHRLGAADSEAWEIIRSQTKGQIRTAQGIYTFETVYPAQPEYCRSSGGAAHPVAQSRQQVSGEEYHWHVASFLSNSFLEKTYKTLATKYFIIGVTGLVLLLSGAWMVAFAVAKRLIYQKQLKELALFDQLTKLPNRVLFFDRLTMMAEHSRRYRSQFAMLYLDLDGFKLVNDSHGHDVGDQLLATVAQRLQSICRRSDTVDRLGGDEFAILYANLRNVGELDTFARRVINELSQSMDLSVGSVRVGVSVGIALFPENSDDVETLVNLADRAMYRSKDSGKNTYTFAHA